MKLYLIRHGETVDNVAGVYAGSRDSSLTNFGFEQAKRLGGWFVENEVRFTHIFASPLSRAFRTAGAIRDAQVGKSTAGGQSGLEIVKVPEIVERDYGSYEGRSWSSKSEWQKTGRDGLEQTSGGVESAQSMAKRGDRFLDRDLLPLFQQTDAEEYVVAVVAHGMLLSHLWRRLLLRLPRKSLTIIPEIVEARGPIVLEHLGSWSNTGFLELSISKDDAARSSAADPVEDESASAEAATLPTLIPPPLQAEGAGVSVAPAQPEEIESGGQPLSNGLTGYSTIILAIDSRKHLFGLKRQPGGIGRLANEEGQKKVDAYFQRQKLT